MRNACWIHSFHFWCHDIYSMYSHRCFSSCLVFAGWNCTVRHTAAQIEIIRRILKIYFVVILVVFLYTVSNFFSVRKYHIYYFTKLYVLSPDWFLWTLLIDRFFIEYLFVFQCDFFSIFFRFQIWLFKINYNQIWNLKKIAMKYVRNSK